MIGRKPEDPRDGGASAAPFVIAVTIVALVVIGIWLVTVTRGGADQEREAVVRAVIGQNDALQRQNFPDFRSYTCSALAGDEADVLARQRESVAVHGARFVEDVTAVSVDGDRGSATAVYYFDNAPGDKVEEQLSVVREDGSWRVCSSAPA